MLGNNSRFLRLFAGVILLVVGLGGGIPAHAQQDTSPTQPSAGATEEAASSPEAPIRTGNTESLFSIIVPPFDYEVNGRRDPFAQPLVERPLDALPSHGPFLPLELVDLSEIKVKAILWDVQKPRALIQGPDGRVHNIGLSDKIGKNNGYVAMIREGELVLVESFEEDGKVYSTTRILPISK